MIITKKALPRRTFLRGIGATMALPLLDSMVPALVATPLVSQAPPRLSFVYVPNGVIMDQWTPATLGHNYKLPPILEPLAPFRDDMLVLSGLAHNTGWALEGEGPGEHARASATFLTGVHPKKTEGADLRAGISVDQIVAKEFRQHTQLASLELALDSTEVVGTCDTGYSCAYSNTLCWSSPTTPVPMENKPRAVFERLFGDSDSTDPDERRSRLRKNRSILDLVTQDVARLLQQLGPKDRSKLGEYLDSIRDIERRIQIAEDQSSRELPSVERPVGVPPTFTGHCKLMMDLQVLAFQTDMTRVITFMMGREQNTRVYNELGIKDAYHPLSHHQNDPTKIAQVLEIDILHSQMFAYFLEKMRSTPDGDGSLLDHSMIVYGSSLSDGNLHVHNDLPILLIGGGAGPINGGRHIRYPDDTPTTNLFLTLLDKLDIPLDQFGDSNKQLDLLASSSTVQNVAE
ncbi:MAG: DUF1552 domain-containing protein [Acidobacteriota bacterium]|nr:DUF1552 domain-containing protein [Acidobacteriota bacterium]